MNFESDSAAAGSTGSPSQKSAILVGDDVLAFIELSQLRTFRLRTLWINHPEAPVLTLVTYSGVAPRPSAIFPASEKGRFNVLTAFRQEVLPLDPLIPTLSTGLALETYWLSDSWVGGELIERTLTFAPGEYLLLDVTQPGGPFKIWGVNTQDLSKKFVIEPH